MSVKCDIIVAGVGGQGVLSLSSMIASAALGEGLNVKQSEVHGMAQRGGAVMAHLRMSDDRISSNLIPEGTAEMILSMEPLESVRYLPFLSKTGTLITSITPIVNIPDYPDLDQLLAEIRKLPSSLLVDSERLAREAGFVKASNMVIVGAASQLLPLKVETMERFIESVFTRKGQDVVDTNIRAFHLGRTAAVEENCLEN